MRGGLPSSFRDFEEELRDGMLVGLICIVPPELGVSGIGAGIGGAPGIAAPP